MDYDDGYNEGYKEGRSDSAALLRQWAATFGDTPTQQALKSIIGEAADRVEWGE